MKTRKQMLGFTIVELLIVVVVIAILAAITIVSYNGITASAKESILKSDLKSGATQVAVVQARTGSYPADVSGLKKSDSTSFQYDITTTGFCLTATSPQLPGKAFYSTENGSLQAGLCSGHTSSGGEVVATTMQSFTNTRCQALTTFTGANNEALVSLTDSRGGTTRTYQVGKLADGKCWMLTNLKLGSTSGPVTLTPADSNVTANFTLPQLITTGSNDYDNPQATGPVPGDTGAGATNYGYLYNWPAATAGKTRTNHDKTAGNSTTSICPANWRLPSGGTTVATSDFGQLDVAFGGTGAYAGAGPSLSWQNTGPFKGVFSGGWSDTFYSQGSDGRFWSSSANPDSTNGAFYAVFSSGYINPGSGNFSRFSGFGVRCLLS